MSERPLRSTTSERRRSAQVLRKRRGGVGAEVIEQNRRRQQVRCTLLEALSAGPGTVPEIAERTGLPSAEVFWHLMAMKKYGKVVEGEQCGDYFQYALKAEGEKGT